MITQPRTDYLQARDNAGNVTGFAYATRDTLGVARWDAYRNGAPAPAGQPQDHGQLLGKGLSTDAARNALRGTIPAPTGKRDPGQHRPARVQQRERFDGIAW